MASLVLAIQGRLQTIHPKRFEATTKGGDLRGGAVTELRTVNDVYSDIFLYVRYAEEMAVYPLLQPRARSETSAMIRLQPCMNLKCFAHTLYPIFGVLDDINAAPCGAREGTLDRENLLIE